VFENVDGKRKQWWARNTLSYDFELLCPDGKFPCTKIEVKNLRLVNCWFYSMYFLVLKKYLVLITYVLPLFLRNLY